SGGSSGHQSRPQRGSITRRRATRRRVARGPVPQHARGVSWSAGRGRRLELGPPSGTLRTHRRQRQRVDTRAQNRRSALADWRAIRQSGAVPPSRPAAPSPLADTLTPRLSIRRLQDSDLSELTEVFEDPEVWWFEYERGLDRAETEAFLERQK